MNKKELSAIAKRLQVVAPHLLAKEKLLFIHPIQSVLRGVYLDRSGDPQRFYAWAFLQVLCVPSDHLYFNLGWRLGGGSHAWNASDPVEIERLEMVIVREALPFLDPIITPRDAALAAKRMGGSADHASLRAIAYAFARHGDTAQAVRELDRYVALGEGDSRDWVRARDQEAKDLKLKLLSDPVGAREQLQKWEAATIRALGLERFANT
jgi:hypothetical protein